MTCSPGSVSTADGSALIRMGGTVVMCGVKAVSKIYTSHSKYEV